MDPDFVRYQEALARTIANNNRLAGIAVIISVFALIVAVYALLVLQRSTSEELVTVPTSARPNKEPISVSESLSPQEIVTLLNREVSSEIIDGVRFDYHLELVSEQKGWFDTRWTIIERSAAKEHAQLFGDGIVAFERRADALLARYGLHLLQTYRSDHPFRDEKADTLILTWGLGIGPKKQ
jgi:hypothetical protein